MQINVEISATPIELNYPVLCEVCTKPAYLYTARIIFNDEDHTISMEACSTTHAQAIVEEYIKSHLDKLDDTTILD